VRVHGQQGKSELGPEEAQGEDAGESDADQESEMTDGQLKRLSLQFRNGLISKRESEMMCGIVSYALQGYLSFLGVDTKSEEVMLQFSNHVFLRLSDGRVLDATADQFGGPKVYLGGGEWYHRDFKKELHATPHQGAGARRK
jgi:hypothetical protein